MFHGLMMSNKKRKSIDEKIKELEEVIQFLLDQDAKKGREIDLLKEKLKRA